MGALASRVPESESQLQTALLSAISPLATPNQAGFLVSNIVYLGCYVLESSFEGKGGLRGELVLELQLALFLFRYRIVSQRGLEARDVIQPIPIQEKR